MDFLGSLASSPATAAALFGALSSVSLPIGAVIGMTAKPSKRVISAVMSFGAGSLLAAIAFELVNPAVERRGAGFAPLAAGLLSGCLLFIFLSRAADSGGASARKRSTLVSSLRSRKRIEAKSLIEKLAAVDILRSLPAEEVRALIPYIHRVDLRAGVPVFRQGSEGRSMFILDSGRVRIEYTDAEGRKAIVAELGSGQTFGEMALVWNASRSADAVPLEDSSAFVVHADDFERLTAASPDLKAAVEHLAQERARTGAIPEARTSAEAWIRSAERGLDEALYKPSETEIRSVAREGHSGAATAIWLGLLLDGIPESLVIGAGMSGFAASPALIAGLFMANLPESLSSSTIMREAGVARGKILRMWSSLVPAVAVGAACGNLISGSLAPAAHSLFEGLAAGSMLAMVAQTMLPEAFERNIGMVGLFTVLGFILTVFFHTLG